MKNQSWIDPADLLNEIGPGKILDEIFIITAPCPMALTV